MDVATEMLVVAGLSLPGAVLVVGVIGDTVLVKLTASRFRTGGSRIAANLHFLAVMSLAFPSSSPDARGSGRWNAACDVPLGRYTPAEWLGLKSVLGRLI